MPSVIIDIEKFTLLPEEQQLIAHPNVAGVLLFTRNIQSRQQIIDLVSAIHHINSNIIVMIDHEGGEVQRIHRHGLTPLMSAGWHGRIYDQNPATGIEIAHQAGKTMASELLAIGIDLSLAPVLDLHHPDSTIIGKLDRAFHADPNIVIELARAYINGMHEAGMPAVAKHFPGHGSCIGDSHQELPKNDRQKLDLFETDLKPFKQLIAEKKLDGIMPAHVMYPNVDPKNIASYSKIWLNDILREQLKFEGLVISDCLGMKGADIGSLADRAEKALLGCDLLITANQKRSDLKAFLDTLPHTQNLDRIKNFKKRQKVHQESFCNQKTNIDETQPKPFDPLNPTQTV